MKEPIYITEEELEYLTNVPNTLNEENMVYSSEEKYERDFPNTISLEEFRDKWIESIRRIIPNP